MKKLLLPVLFLSCMASVAWAQDEEPQEEKKGFKKENLFTGGGISFGLGFSSYGGTFSIGASPVFGYNITKWWDAGIVVNYQYTSSKDYPAEGYKSKVSEYGGGVFTKLYPVKFLYVQAQFEHNFSHWKDSYSGASATYNLDGNSFLIGAGYSTSRDPYNKTPFFHLAILFDVSGNKASPYVDASGNAYPFISTGIQIPLFQGKARKDNYYEEPQQGGGKRPRNYNRY